jgi:hypothetical protein
MVICRRRRETRGFCYGNINLDAAQARDEQRHPVEVLSANGAQMARQALKALSRQRIKHADIPIFFEALEKNESSRTAAILAAAGFEDGLEFAIHNQHMRGMSKIEFESIFDSDGVLGTFGAKIRMGHALRLFGDLTQADLNCIREIRNAFAHAWMALDFDHPAIIEACKDFNGPFGFKREEKDILDARQRFMKVAKHLYLDLLNIATESTPAQATPRLP